jgi:gluconolactonase
MTSRAAIKYTRSRRYVRGCAMACTALALGALPALAQTPPAAPAAAEAAAPAQSKAQIDALLAAPDKVVVLDVRRPDEISKIGGFPAYLNIQAADLDRSLAYIPRDRKIITVSNHAARARKAAALLSEKGFQVAGAAGAQDYEAQGGKLAGKAVVTAAAATAAK